MKIRIIIITLFIVLANLSAQINNYKYDNLNRISQVTYANGTMINYTYDELGNRLSKIVKVATVSVAASANPTTGGSITGAGSYAVGQSCTLAATANTGYSFVNWTENGSVVSTTASYNFSVAGARTLVANFVQNTVNYTVSSSASPSTGGNITGNGTYSGGSSCTLKATANTGYTFVNWTENGAQVSTSASYVFTVGGNRTLVANFTQNPVSYTISASASPSVGGSITGSGSYINGTVCTLTATANSGYTFVNWTENGTPVSTSASYTFAVSGSKSLVAIFSVSSIPSPSTPNTPVPSDGSTGQLSALTLNWSSAFTAGTVSHDLYISSSPTFTNNTLYSGAGISQSISGLAGGTTYYWKVISYGSNGTTSNSSPVWSFTTQGIVSNTVTTSANPAAGGSTTGAGSYQAGQSCTVTATANSGYNFVSWTENSTVVSNNTSYIFTVSGNRTLVANFTLNPVNYTISASANSSAGGSITGNGSYQNGTVCTLTATSNSGYTFVDWTENGTQVSTSTSYVFTVGGNRTLVANFTLTSIPSPTTPNTPMPADGLTGQSTAPTLSWSSAFTGGTITHDLYISTSPTFTNNTLYSGSGTSQVISSLANGTTYYWKVISYGSNGTKSGWSPVWTFTTQSVDNYTISTSANPLEGGSLTGNGSYQAGQPCTVTAIANLGYSFTNWAENGTLVSTNTSYTFTVSANKTLVANFTQNTAITVSFKKPTDWGTTDVFLWAWTGTTTNLFTLWPGVVMNNNGNGWYSYSFDQSVTNVNVIFSKSGISQTEDITGITQSTCYESTGLNGVKITVSAVSCPPTGLIENIAQESLLKVYPNPAQTFLRISTSEFIKRIEVCDIAGRVIDNITINADAYSLNVANLSKGIYLIKGFTDKGIVTNRFIKE